MKNEFSLFSFLFFWMMIPSALFAAGGSKKEEQKALQATMERLMTLADDPFILPPKMIMTDEDAYNYCLDILTRSDEEYSRDTAAVNAWIETYEWVTRNNILLPPKTAKKMKRYDEEALARLYGLAGEMLYRYAPRYDELVKYCDSQLERRREAQARTMPTGRLLAMFYEETGSSRPDPVEYSLERDTLSGDLTLTGYAMHREKVTMKVGEEVAQRVCELIEEYKIYKELGHYGRPSFKGYPEPLGGPPSWYFSCKLEGGTVKTSAEAMTCSRGCVEIAKYLQGLLERRLKIKD